MERQHRVFHTEALAGETRAKKREMENCTSENFLSKIISEPIFVATLRVCHQFIQDTCVCAQIQRQSSISCGTTVCFGAGHFGPNPRSGPSEKRADMGSTQRKPLQKNQTLSTAGSPLQLSIITSSWWLVLVALGPGPSKLSLKVNAAAAITPRGTQMCGNSCQIARH